MGFRLDHMADCINCVLDIRGQGIVYLIEVVTQQMIDHLDRQYTVCFSVQF